jgi:2-desacetyl-2-hydroxyethyl bacteriochlorophyllide A dehydrogenase
MTIPAMLQAVTIEPHRIELRRNDVPSPATGEVLIQTECVGICGSDVHIFHGRHPRATFPRIQGHEASALIVEFGPGYRGSLQPGDRVTIDPLIPCGTCYACRIDRSNCCPNITIIGAHVHGLLQEFAVVPLSTIHVARQLDAAEAALCEPMSVGVQAIDRGAVKPGEQVLVIGAGPIGAAVALAAIDRGARVLAVDRLKSRLEYLQALGVEATIVAGENDLRDAVFAWSGGNGPSVTIDVVGTPSVIRQCCELVSPAGRVVIVGLSDQEVSLPIVDFTYKEMTILGSRASAGKFPEAIDLVERYRERLRPLITHRFPLDEIQSALEFATDHPSETQKVMIVVMPSGEAQ